jgi:hypothetical protein
MWDSCVASFFFSGHRLRSWLGGLLYRFTIALGGSASIMYKFRGQLGLGVEVGYPHVHIPYESHAPHTLFRGTLNTLTIFCAVVAYMRPGDPGFAHMQTVSQP